MAVTYQYLRRRSFLHAMDPLSKAIWLLLLSIQAFVLGSPIFFVIHIGIMAFCGLVLGRVPVRTFLRGTSVMVFLACSLFIFQVLFQHKGVALLAIGPFTVNSGGVKLGLIIGLRILLISVAALVFVWTTNPRDLIVGLVHIGIPYRLGYAIVVAFQFVPLLEQEAAIIRDAHAVRGLAEVSGRIEAWRRYMLPILAFGIRKAEAAAIAMDSRALGAYARRTFLEEFRWTPQGIGFVLAFVVVAVVLIYFAIVTGGTLEQYSGGTL